MGWKGDKLSKWYSWIKNLIGSGIFDYAKPVYLIKRALEMVGMNEGELILDFFLVRQLQVPVMEI